MARSIFGPFPPEPVALVKSDGRRIEGISALVSGKTIFIEDVSACVEEGDSIERNLPNGLVESFEVTDRGFHRGMGPLPDHYQIKYRRLGTGPARPASVSNTYNLYGPNSRVNVSSEDNSTNTLTVVTGNVFQDLRGRIEAEVSDPDLRADLVQKAVEMEAAAGTGGFVARYQAFIQAAANHMTLITPFIPALTQYLTQV